MKRLQNFVCGLFWYEIPLANMFYRLEIISNWSNRMTY